MEVLVKQFAGGSISLSCFADKHGLRMVITERSRASGSPRFYAKFDDVEIKDGSILTAAAGDGDTPEAAVSDYVSKILGRNLVRGAYKSDRLEFTAPNELTESI